MQKLEEKMSTIQTRLGEKIQRLEDLNKEHEHKTKEKIEQVMTFALALESRVAHFASDLQREQLTEFAENLYRDFNVRLLGFDCGRTFLMEAGIDQWSDLIGRQPELEERIRNTMIPEEQRCNTIFRPLVQVPGDIDLRAGEPFPPAVVSAIQAPVQVEAEHGSGKVMVREQQPDIASRPTDHKPEGIDPRVDELPPPASVSDIQGQQPSDNQQGLSSEQRQSVDTNYCDKSSYSAHNDDNQSQSDRTITIDRQSGSDQTDKGERHSDSDQTDKGERHSDSDQTDKGERHSDSDQTDKGERHSDSDQTDKGERHSDSDQTDKGERHSDSDQTDKGERHSDSDQTDKGKRHSDSDQTDKGERHSDSDQTDKGERHSDSDQTDKGERHSDSDQTDKGERHSDSDQTDKGERHSDSDRSHIRGKLHLDIQQRRNQMDPNDEDKADKKQELFETTGLPLSPSQTSWFTSVILDSASPRVFKADCANSMISVATISMLKETSERQLHVAVRPWALALLKDGEILAVTSKNENQILLIDASNLSVIKTIPTSRLYRGVGEYSSERLVVSCCKDEDGEASIDVITWKGEVERTLATSQKLTGLSQPHYLFVHNDDVFISDFSSDYVYCLDRTTGEMTQTMTDPQLQSPCQVSIDPAGKLYVASWTNGRVLKKSSAHGMPQPLLVWERDAESGYKHSRCVSVTDTNLLVSWDRSRGFPMNSVLKAYHIQRLDNKVTWIPDYPFNIIHSKKPHV